MTHLRSDPLASTTFAIAGVLVTLTEIADGITVYAVRATWRGLALRDLERDTSDVEEAWTAYVDAVHQVTEAIEAP